MNNWLTKQLRDEVNTIFSQKYGRALTEKEITEISNNIVNCFEIYFQWKWRQSIETK